MLHILVLTGKLARRKTLLQKIVFWSKRSKANFHSSKIAWQNTTLHILLNTTNPLLKRDDIKLWGCFSLTVTGKMIKVDEKMERTENKVWEEKSCYGLWKTWVWNRGTGVLKWSRQYPDLCPTKNLWQVIDMDFLKLRLSFFAHTNQYSICKIGMDII